MKKIALASDFDNTLHFRHNGVGYIKDVDRIAVSRFRKKGHLFGTCTGRPFVSLLAETEDNIDVDFHIVSTGGLITEGDKPYTVIKEHTISAKTVCDIYRNFHDVLDIYVHADGKVNVFEEYAYAYPEQVLLQSEEELNGKHITGISGHAKSAEISEDSVKKLNAMYEDISAYQNIDWLDIVPHGISKGTGIQTIKEVKKIDIMAAIGDAQNDMSSLQNADISFTFPYAPDDVKACATHIVDHLADAIKILEELAEK